MWYVQVIGPNDQVFVGSFESEDTANAWIAKRQRVPEHSENFDFYPMTEQAMRDNIAEFGAISIQTPEQTEEGDDETE